ncbi:MAG: hypothetical protein ACLFWM_14710 [Actinomycetota bacterium]
MKTTSIAFLTALALFTSACNGEEAAPTTTIAADPDAVVLTVTSEGGFVPVEFNLDRMPRFVLTADRSLYFPGPSTEEFPGPILPNIRVAALDAATYGEVMDLVEELGLEDIGERVDDTGADRVADATTEFITYHDDEGAHRYGFYALGLTGGGSTDRLLASEIIDVLDEAASTLDSAAYEAERLQVAAGPPMQMEEALRTTRPWPLDASFEEMEDWGMGWHCSELSGPQVDDLLETFSDANQATVWESESGEFAMRARPLLPGESACGNAPPTS